MRNMINAHTHLCLIIGCLLLVISGYSQTYILNEDFTSANGTTAPVQWTNISNTSVVSDLWHFDNPGNRSIDFPVSGQFAIFDSDNYSQNGTIDEASLESPYFDASIGNYIYLFFDHRFTGHSGDTAIVEAFNGTAWQQIINFTDSTANTQSEMFDVSAMFGGTANAKLRFRWKGNGVNYWAVDNISVFAPLAVDLGILDFAAPIMPFASGSQDIELNLKNFGAIPVTSATVQWELNGILQSPLSWTGNLSFADTITNVSVGSHNFVSGQSVHIKAWIENPNSSLDANPLNDTIEIDLSAPLCGTYTIGGTNPDFQTFTDAVTILNNAGVSCPVVFFIRNGMYSDQIEIGQIGGVDSVNTVTFRGESLDSSAVTLQYTQSNPVLNYTVKLTNTNHIFFEHLGIKRTSGDGPVIISNSNNIRISNSWLDGDEAVTVGGGCFEIEINHNYFANGGYSAINIYGNQSDSIYNIMVTGNTIQGSSNYSIKLNYVNEFELTNNTILNLQYGIGVFSSNNGTVTGNHIENSSKFGMVVENSDWLTIANNNILNMTQYGMSIRYSENIDILSNNIHDLEHYGLNIFSCDSVQIANNRITGIENSNGIQLSSANIWVHNNFVQIEGQAVKSGIYSDTYANNCKILFNSINLTSTNSQSTAITIGNANNLEIKNNIFANNGGGFAIKMQTQPTGLQLDYNNYFTSGNQLAQYNSTDYQQLSTWQTATGMDANSVNANPFYTDEINLQPNQALVNNVGLAIPLITIDIDSTIRPVTPDIGAKEFSLCANDAGINGFVGISSPAMVGTQNITIILQNQGNTTLNSCSIHWSINGVQQSSFAWTGSLAPTQNQIVQIGSTTLTGGNNYNFMAWTSNPNGATDCDNYNDTSLINDISTPLCGTYTIGGTNPDFQTFTDAVTILNNAGVSCPVVFFIRNGMYSDQIEIGQIGGVDSVNTVTFRGESLDSSAVTLQYTQSNPVLNYTVKLTNTNHIFFEHLGIKRTSGDGPVIISNSNNIRISNSWLDGDEAVTVGGGCFEIEINHNYFANGGYSAINIYGNQSDSIYNIMVTGNTIQGSSNYSIKLNYVNEFELTNNTILNLQYGIGVFSSNNGTVTGNHIENSSKFGMVVENSDWLTIANNNILNMTQYGMSIRYSENIDILSNNIHDLEHYGLNIFSCDSVQIANNRITGIENSNGIQLSSANIWVHNNFVQIEGQAVKSGIYSDTYANNCKILFNSINLTSTNSQSTAITIGNANNLEIKNNIFANNGGGFAIKMQTQPTGLQLDYNNYFTSGNQLAQYNSTDYQQLSTWQTATGMDANSLSYNPYYISDTELRPYQRELNGAGIPITGILLDIDDQIRDENAPDIGADEFMVDFGITDIFSPDLHCALTANDSVTIQLKQFGDIPFNKIQLAYQVNGGTIFTDVATGSINNDITFTFSQTQNLSGYGTYVFKIWIINSFDDNINNDTIIVERYSNPIPQITITQSTGCAGTPIQYSTNATISVGTIGGYFWDFGDSTTDSIQNPGHLYDTSGIYSVHLFVYSDVGCYNDTVFLSSVLTTPQANFITGNVCLGDTAFFTNLSTVSSGNMTYSWNFGNTVTSTDPNPFTLYSQPDTFHVMLATTGANSCADTFYQNIVIHPLPALSFLNLPVSFCSNDTALMLSTLPAGANVNSTAYANGWFYPSLASIGTNNISMNYTDAFGCSDTIITTVDVFQAPGVAISGLGPQYCISGEDPVITGTPQGGSFSGTGIAGNQFSIANAGIGNHEVSYSYTASNGCSDIVSQWVQVAEFNQFNFDFIVDSVVCHNTQTGGIDLVVNYTQQNYSSLVWSNGVSSEDLAMIPTGMYGVSVTDTWGCTHSDSVFLSNPDTLAVQSTVIDVACHGDNSGSINLTSSGGQSPYLYSWSNSSSQAVLQNLPAGSYIYTVTDNLGCLLLDTLFIAQPGMALGINSIVTNVSCFGEPTGAISISGNGGTSPYSVVGWSNGASSLTITNISAGNYSVTLSDANSCTESISLLVSEPVSAFSVQLFGTDVNCYGDQNGTVISSLSGGTSPYQNFTWSNGASTQNLNTLTAGLYSLTAYDSNNCADTASILISEPSDATVSFAITDLVCYGQSTGEIQTTITGASPPYSSFTWSSGQNTQNISNIPAGNYTISFTDANACQFTASSNVNSPPDLVFDFILTEPLCHGESNGAIDMRITGATPPYTAHLWSNAMVAEDLANIPAGNYTVTVTDANNCNFEGSITLSQPDSILLEYQVIDVLCYGQSNGVIDMTISGGTPPYPLIHWSNSSYTEDITGLPAGDYQVTITDDNNCIKYGEVTVFEPDVLAFDATLVHVQCYGESNGSIEVIPKGGSPPFQVQWYNSSTSNPIENLEQGNYSFTITDINNCETEADLTIESPTEIEAQADIVPLTCMFAEDAAIHVHLDGGVSPYIFNWYHGEYTESIFALSYGTYAVLVADSNQCQKEFEFIIPESEIPCLDIPNVFSPNGDGVNDTWEISGIEFVPGCEIKVLDRWGRAVFESLGYSILWDGRYDGKQLPSDAYFYIIEYHNGHESITGKVSIIY